MTSKFRPSHLISWLLWPDTPDNRHVLEVVVSHSLVSRDEIISMVCEYHQNALGQFIKSLTSGAEIKSLSGMIVGRYSVRFDDKFCGTGPQLETVHYFLTGSGVGGLENFEINCLQRL